MEDTNDTFFHLYIVDNYVSLDFTEIHSLPLSTAFTIALPDRFVDTAAPRPLMFCDMILPFDGTKAPRAFAGLVGETTIAPLISTNKLSNLYI